MTDAEIRQAFSDMSIQANKTQHGADYVAILEAIAVESGKPFEDVRDLIVADTINGNV